VATSTSLTAFYDKSKASTADKYAALSSRPVLAVNLSPRPASSDQVVNVRHCRDGSEKIITVPPYKAEYVKRSEDKPTEKGKKLNCTLVARGNLFCWKT
jgi:hypothetical protein